MQALEELGERIWAWRAVTQPRVRDDIPRLDRPDGWRPAVGPDAFDAQREQRAAFAAELAALHPTDVADRVDHRLLQSALARVEWELDVVQVWRQPSYWLDQAVGPVYDALLAPVIDPTEIGRRLGLVAAVVEVALPILATDAVREFADLALGELQVLADWPTQLADALGDPTLTDPAAAATTALTTLRDQLRRDRPAMAAWRPIGVERYEWFLREVACIPFGATEIAAIGEREFDRAVTFEQIARGRTHGTPTFFADVDAQIERERQDELAVRQRYADGLLTQPDDLAHYRFVPMPDYLAPVEFFGVADDLTGPARLDEDGRRLVPPPHPDLPYFHRANAFDPRLGISHEGVHFQQLAMAWRSARPLRRHYYDSGPNEGIAFYNEELMLAAGLFDDAPHSRAMIYNMMRLRALRVGVDVGLATGRLSIADAAQQLAVDVPVDKQTADEEAAFFAQTPGQALTYQIGKTQILALIADAQRQQGDAFDLQATHDYLWRNGNVPIALLRWELLGRTDELEAIGVDA